MDIQALWFSAEAFTESEAQDWAQDHDFLSDTVRTREEEGLITHYILPQFEPSEGKEGTWRTIADDFPEGVSATICEREMESKAFSTFELKTIDTEQRRISGIASTPAADRDGDEVMPKGATFTLPFPLLHQHDHERPIGHVTKATVTDDGIEIEAEIPKDTGLSYVEMAWRQIKSGLLRGLSIGFRASKSEPTRTGRKFTAYEIFELSAVSIPANAQAGIMAVKQFDAEPFDAEEHLFQLESKKADVLDRAAAAVTKASKSIQSKRIKK